MSEFKNKEKPMSKNKKYIDEIVSMPEIGIRLLMHSMLEREKITDNQMEYYKDRAEFAKEAEAFVKNIRNFFYSKRHYTVLTEQEFEFIDWANEILKA